MTKQALIYKWLVYGLVLIPIWLLDSLVLCRYPLFGTIRPTLIPLAVVAVATLEGGFAGAGYGLGAGILWAAAYAGSHGERIILLIVAGLLVGLIAQYALNQNFSGCFISSLVVLAVLALWQVLWGMFFQKAAGSVLLQVGVGEVLWSLVWSPLVYALFWAVYRRVGGVQLGKTY